MRRLPPGAALIVALATLGVASAAVQCRNNAGQPVDWWFMYKLPGGYVASYMDVNGGTLQPTLTLEQPTALSITLDQTANPGTTGYAMYNDQPPSHVQSIPMLRATSVGHTKGVVGFDSSTGYWLIHSTPRFPVSGTNSTFPSNERYYGQSFLCISLAAATLNDVGSALRVNAPGFFGSYVPAYLPNLAPNLSSAIAKQFVNSADSATIPIRSLGGVPFKVFAKTRLWNADLYADLVAPTLRANLLAETWRRSPYLSSYCQPPYTVENVNTLQLGSLVFNYTRDHAKWAMSKTAAEGNWVCIGDINRMDSQYIRGGGTACFQQAGLWQALNAVVLGTESC